MLGNYVSSYLSSFYKVIKLTRKDYDISKLSILSLERFLTKIEKDDIIINCSGAIPQRGGDKKYYYVVNSLFPVVLSMYCKQKDIKLIHITTDCVYSGDIGNYDENSISNETNDYGISKSLGDMAYGTIIRTSIIGEETENKKSLLEWLKLNKNKTVNGYADHYWNGVTCLELSKIICKIIGENDFWVGIKHVFSPTSVSKYELLMMINEIYDLNVNIIKTFTEKCDKTLSSIYSKFDVPELYQQIQELRNYKL